MGNISQQTKQQGTTSYGPKHGLLRRPSVHVVSIRGQPPKPGSNPPAPRPNSQRFIYKFRIPITISPQWPCGLAGGVCEVCVAAIAASATTHRQRIASSIRPPTEAKPTGFRSRLPPFDPQRGLAGELFGEDSSRHSFYSSLAFFFCFLCFHCSVQLAGISLDLKMLYIADRSSLIEYRS